MTDEVDRVHELVAQCRLSELKGVQADHDDHVGDIDSPEEEGPGEEGGKMKKKARRKTKRKKVIGLGDCVLFIAEPPQKAASIPWTEGGCVPPEQPLHLHPETPEQTAQWEKRLGKSVKTLAIPTFVTRFDRQWVRLSASMSSIQLDDLVQRLRNTSTSFVPHLADHWNFTRRD